MLIFSILIYMFSFTLQKDLSLYFTWTARLRCRTRCKRDYTLNVDDKLASLLTQNILAMTNGKTGEHVRCKWDAQK